MGANIEIDIFLQDNVCLKQIFSILEKERCSVSIQKFSIFDDWHYTNFKEIDTLSREKYLEDTHLEKFSLTNFILNNQWECTLITSLEEGMYRDFSFGFPTQGLISIIEKTSDEVLDNAIEAFYEKVTTIINDALSREQWKENFVAASMGIEYSVEFNCNILAMLQDENGAMKWVLPKDIGIPLSLEKFSKEEKSDVIVFTYIR